MKMFGSQQYPASMKQIIKVSKADAGHFVTKVSFAGADSYVTNVPIKR
jgi:hypothetical protein